jgi:hypothetical protein
MASFTEAYGTFYEEDPSGPKAVIPGTAMVFWLGNDFVWNSDTEVTTLPSAQHMEHLNSLCKILRCYECHVVLYSKGHPYEQGGSFFDRNMSLCIEHLQQRGMFCLSVDGFVEEFKNDLVDRYHFGSKARIKSGFDSFVLSTLKVVRALQPSVTLRNNFRFRVIWRAYLELRMRDARMAVGASVPSGDADDFSFDVKGLRKEEAVLGKLTWYVDKPLQSAASGGAGSSAGSAGAAAHRSVYQQVVDDIKAKLAHARAMSTEWRVPAHGLLRQEQTCVP